MSVSIPTTSVPPEVERLSGLRESIDKLDEELLLLLKRRMSVVASVAAYKRRTGTPIRDRIREQQVIDARRARASDLGLAAESIESIFSQVMLASRKHQASLGATASSRQERRNVAIIGARGGMGRLLANVFSDMGHTVTPADVDTPVTAREAAAVADVVIISVPIVATEGVIRDVGPLVRRDAVLCDVTSIKQGPVGAMMEATEASGASVVGCHPMFGPGAQTLLGQRVVLCPGRGDGWYQWLKHAFEERGLVVTESTPADHDAAMAVVQVLVHFQTQVLGMTLVRSGVTLTDSLRFTSPAYLMELYIAARHFSQAPELYGPIEMRNPSTPQITQAFAEAATELSEVLCTGDQSRFERMFAEVRDFFGDFAVEATEQSRHLIDHLVGLAYPRHEDQGAR